MKKQGNCDQCGKDDELTNTIQSTFHRHFKYRKFPIVVTCFFNVRNCSDSMYLCKKCKLEVMRAMKNGDNWE